ncbi:MAG: hypothetical protein J4F40_08175 [Alphaproteobacteria bacterium]|nr:hypothetical protein [Alphaproteobacteria bacterium]
MLPHGAWHSWLESRGIAKRTVTRWMELARKFEFSQIGRFESVDAAASLGLRRTSGSI